jgi:uncharacterized protein (DUF305 family)
LLHAVGVGPHGQVAVAAGHAMAGRTIEGEGGEMRTIQRSATGLTALAIGTFWLALSAAAQATDVDLWFIDNMTAHHQGAVRMARDALKKAKHPELKTFARQIIKDQTGEINQMKKWRNAWYKGAPSAKSKNIPGMQMTHTASGGYDVQFLHDMVAHHEGAIEMSKEVPDKGKRPEIKQLAQQVIKAQEAEIEKMKRWRTEWEKA